MGKQRIKEDPIKQYDSFFQAAAENKKRKFNSGLGSVASSKTVGFNTGFGDSNYDKNLSWDAEVDTTNDETIHDSINEHRANEEGFLPTLGAGLARAATKAVVETAKLPGIIGGLVGATAGEIEDGVSGVDNHTFIDTAFNNGWIKGLDKANEYLKDEYMPVYVSKAVQDGDLGTKMLSSEFWATDGADGLGYALGMIVPGQILGKLGLGAKLLGGIDKMAEGTKLFNGITRAENFASKMGIVGDSFIDSSIAIGYNTAAEAGAEASQAGDELRTQKDPIIKGWVDLGYLKSKEFQKEKLDYFAELDLKRRNGQITIDEQNTLINDENLSTKEILNRRFKNEVADAQSRLFGRNALLLLGPNTLMHMQLFGKLGREAEKIVEKTATSKIGKALETTLAKRIGKVGTIGAENLASEGFYEEGFQTSSAEQFKNYVKQNRSEEIGIADVSKDTFTEYAKMLGTTEGKVSIMLGGVLGGGMSSIAAYGKTKKEAKIKNEILNNLSIPLNNLNTVFNISDIYKKNEDNSTIYKKDKNGNLTTEPETDLAKSQDLLRSLILIDNKFDKYQEAVDKGDNSYIEEQQSNGMFELAKTAAYNGEKGLSLLKQQLEKNSELEDVKARDENIDKNSKSNKQIVKETMELAEFLSKQNDKFNNFSKGLIDLKDDRLEDKKSSKVFKTAFMNELNSRYLNVQHKLRFNENKLKQLEENRKNAFEELGADPLYNETLDNPILDMKSGIISNDEMFKRAEKTKKLLNENTLLRKVQDEYNETFEKIKKNKKDISEVWEGQLLDKSFKDFTTDLLTKKEQTSEEKVQETDNINNNIKSATTTEELDEIKPNEYTAEQFNQKREELENYKTGEREQEVVEKTADTNVRQVLKTDIPEYFDDMGESYRKGIDGNFYTLINRDSNGNILFENNTTGERVLAVDKITKQEETTVDDIVVGSANDFKVVDPKIVSDGTVKDDGKSPGSVKNNKQYKDYLLESRDKKGDVVTFSVNRTAGKDYNSFYNIYDKFLKTGELSNTERQELIDNLPITFHYNNNSSSFSSHVGKINTQLRISIINHLKEGVKLENLQSVVTNQANADFNNQIVDNKPAVNNVLDVAEFNKDTKNLVLYHINTDGKFIVVSEKQEDFQGSHKVNTDLSGNIFVVMSHPKGYKVPVKLNSNKLNITQSEGLALLYKELTKSENTEKRVQVLENLEATEKNNVKAKILNLLSKEILLLGGNPNKISIDEMIKLLVLENSSKDSNKSIEIGIDENGNQTVKFNNSEYNLENGIEDFVKDLTENKKQNVITIETDVTKIGDKGITFKNQGYLEYLFNNKIVSTDINTNPEEGNFKTASSNTKQGSEVYIRSAVESNKQTTNTVFSGEQSFADKIQGKTDLTGVETSNQSEIEAKKADIEKRKQSLKDLMKATGEDIYEMAVFDGSFNGEGYLDMDNKDNVILTRFADTTENLTKGGKILNPEDLKKGANSHSNQAVSTSAVEGGVISYVKEDGVMGKYKIPITELIKLMKEGYVHFAGIGNKEFVLSPHIAEKYLYSINDNLLNSKNNSENIRNNENNSVSLPNNVKIENEMDIPNTQDNLDYKEAIDKIISDNKMTVDLQRNIDILAKNIEMRDSEDFKNKSEKYQNKILENIKKANIEMPQLIKNCG